MKKYLVLFCVFFVLSCFFVSCKFNEDESPIIASARALVERQIGGRAKSINFQVISTCGGKDVFGVEAKDGVLTLKGSSPVAICYAFHLYLREACLCMKTWSGENMDLPQSWPDYSQSQQVSPYFYRYFLNVCTFGYTTPYWDWQRWEQEIDWMALRGVNMPLATVASEAIAKRVWSQMGLNEEEIQDFFTGPAHLPWHRMGNLNSWDGPLTDSWHENQIELQHLILNRMRELGMSPIAPAFAGFVPMAFALKHPEIKFKHLRWGGFDEYNNAYVLPPDSPFFEEIGKLFIQEWEKEFGENKFYLSDSFNEMELPVKDGDEAGKHKLLADYGESIYKSISSGNPEAVWVTQGWTFGYQHSFWDQASLKALLSKVPDDKMLIVDLGNDYPKWVWNTEQTWKVHDGFYGKKWIFSYVPNFGGKNALTGDLAMYSSSSSEALQSPGRGNLVGFGSAPEGLENNEVVYELLADMGWTAQPIDLDQWMGSYAKARYGAYPACLKSSWDELRSSAYSSLYSYPRFTWQTVVPDSRRVSKIDVGDHFFKAVELFLLGTDSVALSCLYVNDAVELASFYVGAKADKLYGMALAADGVGDSILARQYLDRVVKMLGDVDRLLASHPLHRLEPWVKLARGRGSNLLESNSYEANAKRLITTWGGFQEDYAARFWSGLIKDYYIPRLKMYFSTQRADLESWEESWINTPWLDSSEPFNDPLKAAKELVRQVAGV